MIQKGFSLIEILIVIFILSSLIFVIASAQRFVSESARFSFEELSAVEQARGGIDSLVREIREALPSDSGAYPLVKADDYEIIFYADVDNDDSVERVHYFLDQGKLKKGVIEPTDTIPVEYPSDSEKVWTVAEGIVNDSDPIFYYYNGDWPLSIEGNPLDTPSRLVETKYMRVFLKVNIEPSRIPGDFELSSGINLRNLKENL